ncbi:MAG: hypothetical protein M1444_02910 [Patescibacteria group bacterium]|nr:hypothetical protein [Patescibacteria group bacterium]
MKKTHVELYNGANFCHGKSSCPVVVYDKKAATIRLNDPAKPENGQYTMTVEEYNTLLENAKKVA